MALEETQMFEGSSTSPCTQLSPAQLVRRAFHCRRVEETEQTPSKRQRVLRSSQNCEHGAPELPDCEAPLSSDAQGDESDEGPPVEMLGRRKRAKVDYQKLNAEMFGDVECYEGEATEDEDFSPRAEARTGGES